MELNRRFTILTFPQFFDGNILKLNIVFLPRNQNPLTGAIEGDPNIPDAPAFADAELSFTAKIITGLSDFPSNNIVIPPITLATNQPANARGIFEALANQFQIKNKGVQNTNLNINSYPEKTPGTTDQEHSVKKYLPLSYRKSFNFISPKTKNAVIDDSYHCAVRDAKPSGFISSPEEISWGQVFAHAMRQSLIARSIGMVYETQVTVQPSYFPKGGWLYVDVGDDSDYREQQTATENGIINGAFDEEKDGFFIKKYAARIPALEIGKERSLFAAIQFPVLFKKPADVVDPLPKGNFDNIFIEAANYDDGFTKIVHAFQPVSQNLLLEESDGFHPNQEVGIRLGWDDEQILIWYMRQLMEDETVGPKKRIDAPIGVLGYNIDVREKKVPEVDWNSLNGVISKENIKVVDPVTNEEIVLDEFEGELLYQVYPSQLDNNPNANYWLPIYFANWNGKSMVLPDDEASAIYQNDKVKPDSTINVKGVPANNLNKIYNPKKIETSLQYGKIYQFRVRLGDLSGGGPDSKKEPAFEESSQIAECHFKRFIAPNQVRIDDVPPNSDDIVFSKNELKIKRPILGYPSVVFTGKYPNAVDLLKQAAKDQVDIAEKNKKAIDDGHPEDVKPLEAFGIADPDVQSVEITVEVQALKMDYLLSVSGKESYCKLYTTTRNFPIGFNDELSVPLEFKDCNVLNFGDPLDLGDLGFTQAEIDALPQLVLPTARNIRLTLRAVCEEKIGYYGLEKDDPEFNTRFGRTRLVMLYKPSNDERELFEVTSPAERIKAIYLQPDPPPPVFHYNFVDLLVGKQVEKIPDMIQRLAQTLGLENIGLSLVGKKGERIQFGCSNRIRHTLAPDNSSITFATKGDLMNHWLCCIKLQIKRDWTWDALQDRSFIIKRKKKFKQDNDSDAEILEVGEIEVKKTISINALQDPNRNETTIIFIDAVEPKNDPKFPDIIEVEYTIETKFKADHAEDKDDSLTLPLLELPVTNTPEQLPKIVSAGLALSPYQRNEKYSSTEPRRRSLWIEFDEPIKDTNDIYFARVLAYSPDQLLSNNNPELLSAPDEPSLPIDPEYIRIITPGQSDDEAGINAMQPMEKAIDSDRHYLLPIPSGLHSESPELFGFFTYEFRVGHAKIWSTAQGRFGRALRATGVQHPAPTLTCVVNRDEEKLYVTAPYAVAVHKGKNVTSDPPRTEIWCLLYAQVKQADNKDFRNILLDEKKLDWRVRVEHNKQVNLLEKYNDAQIKTLKYLSVKNWKDELSYGNFKKVFKLAEEVTINKDATKYGTAIWSNNEINQILTLFGLPHDVSLSVLCVEILPHITNIYDHINGLHTQNVKNNVSKVVDTKNLPNDEEIKLRSAARTNAANIDESKPLSDNLGHYRILRTSPLTEVPYVCCTDC